MKAIWAIFRFVAVLAALLFPQLASSGYSGADCEDTIDEFVDSVDAGELADSDEIRWSSVGKYQSSGRWKLRHL